MGDTKKYFWLKLRNDFFSQKEIKGLRRIKGGDKFVLIYIKLMLSSIQDEGRIYFDGYGNTLAAEIAMTIDEDENDVISVVNYLKHYSLIEKVEDDEYILTAVPTMIGKETDAAERMRKHRKKLSNDESSNNVTPELRSCNVDITPLLHRDREEIDIDKRKEDPYKEKRVEINPDINVYKEPIEKENIDSGYGPVEKNNQNVPITNRSMHTEKDIINFIISLTGYKDQDYISKQLLEKFWINHYDVDEIYNCIKENEGLIRLELRDIDCKVPTVIDNIIDIVEDCFSGNNDIPF